MTLCFLSRCNKLCPRIWVFRILGPPVLNDVTLSFPVSHYFTNSFLWLFSLQGTSAVNDTKRESRRTPFIKVEQTQASQQTLFPAPFNYLSLAYYRLNAVVKLETKQTYDINHESIHAVRRYVSIIHGISHLESCAIQPVSFKGKQCLSLPVLCAHAHIWHDQLFLRLREIMF